MLDDPAMMSSILPFWMSVQPKFIRWSVCSQEFCFNPAYSSLIHTISGEENNQRLLSTAQRFQFKPNLFEVTRVDTSQQ